MFKPSWQSGYAARKKGAYLIISAVVWGSIPHVIFYFQLAKVLSHKVHMKSLQSPHRVPPLWGLYRESLRTSLGLLGDSLGTPQQRVAQCNDLPTSTTHPIL